MNRCFWRYDDTADVLHITTDTMANCYGEPLENFESVVIVLRDIDTNEIVGLRILGAKANGVQSVRVRIHREQRVLEQFEVRGRLVHEGADEDLASQLARIDEMLGSPPPDFKRRDLLLA